MVIFLFSGVFPFAKLGCCLGCWYCKTDDMSIKLRAKILHYLDLYGKFSLVDVYVLLTIVATLNITMMFSRGCGIGIEVRTTDGFMSFLYGTVLALITGHLVLHYHDCDPRTGVLNEDGGGHVQRWRNEELRALHRALPLRELRKHMKRSGQKAFRDYIMEPVEYAVSRDKIAFALGGAALCVLLGSVATAFRMEFCGLIGYLMQQDPAAGADAARANWRSFSLVPRDHRLLNVVEVLIQFGSLSAVSAPIFASTFVLQYFFEIHKTCS